MITGGSDTKGTRTSLKTSVSSLTTTGSGGGTDIRFRLRLIAGLVFFGVGFGFVQRVVWGAAGGDMLGTRWLVDGQAIFQLLVAGGVLAVASYDKASNDALVVSGMVLGWACALATELSFMGMPPPEYPLRGMPWSTMAVVFLPLFLPMGTWRAALYTLTAAASFPLSALLWAAAGADPPAADSIAIFSSGPFLAATFAIATVHLHDRQIKAMLDKNAELRRMGSYHLETLLGKGGMGEVWKASHGLLARPAAIKIIRPEVLASAGIGLDEAQQGFLEEAQHIADLQSPHTVSLHDFGVTRNGSVYTVMELLHGLDLNEIVERHGPMPPERVVHLLLGVCESLNEAHQRGLVHRDIKPANVLACHYALEVDFVKVVDFGIAQRMEEDITLSSTFDRPIRGTPAFMAPELAHGAAVEPRSDLYSIGCLAYWLLTGNPVFPASTPLDVLVRHSRDTPEPPSRHSRYPVPAELDALLLACLSRHPEDRPQTAAELAERLRAIPLEEAWTQDRAREWWADKQEEDPLDESSNVTFSFDPAAMEAPPGI